MKLVLSMSETSGRKNSSDLVHSTGLTYVFQKSGPNAFFLNCESIRAGNIVVKF